MDIRDRAIQAALNFAGQRISSADGSYDLLITVVMDAMQDAIQAEREACAVLIDKQAKEIDVLIDHAPTPLRAEDLKRVKHSLNVVAAYMLTRV